MPLTFPSHAAAILPLHALTGRLPLPALIVGSAAPDFAYSLGMDRDLAHTWQGVFLFCAPVGFAVWLLFEAAILPALRATLPRLLGVELGRFAATDGVPRSLAAAGWALAALALGAATHVLWDGFTHGYRWPATALYGERWTSVGGFRFQIANAAQYLSSIGGAAVMLAYARHRYPGLPASGIGSARWTLALLLALAIGTAASLLLSWDVITAGRTFQRQLWLAFFVGMRGTFLGLALWAAVWLVRQRSRRAGAPAART